MSQISAIVLTELHISYNQEMHNILVRARGRKGQSFAVIAYLLLKIKEYVTDQKCLPDHAKSCIERRQHHKIHVSPGSESRRCSKPRVNKFQTKSELQVTMRRTMQI